ncbi:Uncharacterised protein [Mannheimia haemolytica]|uniref:Uncharacterized protein n=1 Tax=Mannheimia haemolytica TaxID=75985 RepID=A0A378MXG3_MANHA|nr:Uncharacterised protein [Mannheimia haemolytica]
MEIAVLHRRAVDAVGIQLAITFMETSDVVIIQRAAFVEVI